MKRALMCGVAALVLAGTASAEGFVSGSYQSNDFGGGASFDAYSLSGRYQLTANVMLDGSYTSLDGDIDMFRIGGHFFGRGENWLLGGYVGYENAEVSGFDDDFTLAGEGQYYLDRVTLSATVGYSNGDISLAGIDVDLWTVSGGLRYFITDNFSLNGTAGWGQVEAAGSSKSGSAFGVGVEYQFDSSPVSVYAGYRTTDLVFTDVDVWGIGLRWNFGDATLIQRDRSGARLSQPAGIIENFIGGIQPQ